MGEETYAKQKAPRKVVPAAVPCRRRDLCRAGVPVCSAAASTDPADTAGHKGAGGVHTGGAEHSRCRCLVHLPGVGPRNAQAILDYRAQYGPFAQVEDAAQVPGITRAMVDSWAGQAYVR